MALMSCHPRGPADTIARVPRPRGSAAPSAGVCRLASVDDGGPRDPALDGAARRDPPRCCPSRYGFDPELARRACGFADYLGESEELACVHRFAGADGRVHELRLTPFADLDFADAVALHGAGIPASERLPGVDDPGELPGVARSRHGARRWVIVDGWPAPRRLGWDEDACAEAAIEPVIKAMAAAPVEADFDPRVALPRLPIPTATASDTGLLAAQTAAAKPTPYALPRDAAPLLTALLAAAVHDDLAAFTALLDEDARLGLPDRRQQGARAILRDDDGRQALQALRHSAARLALRPPTCPGFDRRLRAPITRGELPMWCVWASDDGLDLLIVALRGRVTDGHADARVEYLGLFPTPPSQPLRIPGEPPAPPIYPQPDLVCGDPHTVDYPGLCPSKHDDADDGDGDADGDGDDDGDEGDDANDDDGDDDGDDDDTNDDADEYDEYDDEAE